MRKLLLLAAFGTAAPLGAQSASTFEFTIPNIMRGPELYGREPSNVRWSNDGKWIYFSWLEPGASWREPARPFRVRAVAGAKPERVTTLQMDSATVSVTQGLMSPDRRRRAASSNGDLYLIDANGGAAKRLTATLAAESSPSFSADGKELYYLRDGNVYALTLDGGLTRQLTDIRTPTAAGAAAAGRSAQATAAALTQRGALQAEQRVLLEAVRDRLWQDSVAAAERDMLRPMVPALTLLPNERAFGVAVSPRAAALVLSTNIPAEGAQGIIVPNYITASGYTEAIQGRTKVGDAQGSGRLLFATLPSGSLKVLRIAPTDGTGPSSQASIVGWNDAGTMALVTANTRDFKQRYLATVSADSGAVHVVDVLTDSAWVGGPCSRCAGWYDGGRRIYFVSEADGYAHLYSMNADGSDRRQLTTGQFEVNGVQLSRDGRTFYLTTSEGSAYEQHVYRMAIAGGAARAPDEWRRRPQRHAVAGRDDVRGRLLDGEPAAGAVHHAEPPERDGGAAHRVADGGVARVRLAEAGDRRHPGERRPARAGAHLPAAGARRAAERRGRDLRARRRLFAQRA